MSPLGKAMTPHSSTLAHGKFHGQRSQVGCSPKSEKKIKIDFKLKKKIEAFSGGLVARILGFHCYDLGSVPS